MSNSCSIKVDRGIEGWFPSAFAIDDSENQFLADYYGVVMGTRREMFFFFFFFISIIAFNSLFLYSHQEPMMRSTPNEFSLFGKGSWAYTTNAANINQFWLEGAERARPFESVYTIGMRGFGDCMLVLSFWLSLSLILYFKCRYPKLRTYLCWRVWSETRL